jgi:uncharacterized DUF497 family protein
MQKNMLEFEWDKEKDRQNKLKHGVSFKDAKQAFFDPQCVFTNDPEHSQTEERFHCLGVVKRKILTVRFTRREGKIRIIGAGYWRKGRKIYEKENNR